MAIQLLHKSPYEVSRELLESTVYGFSEYFYYEPLEYLLGPPNIRKKPPTKHQLEILCTLLNLYAVAEQKVVRITNKWERGKDYGEVYITDAYMSASGKTICLRLLNATYPDYVYIDDASVYSLLFDKPSSVFNVHQERLNSFSDVKYWTGVAHNYALSCREAMIIELLSYYVPYTSLAKPVFETLGLCPKDSNMNRKVTYIIKESSITEGYTRGKIPHIMVTLQNQPNRVTFYIYYDQTNYTFHISVLTDNQAFRSSISVWSIVKDFVIQSARLTTVSVPVTLYMLARSGHPILPTHERIPFRTNG